MTYKLTDTFRLPDFWMLDMPRPRITLKIRHTMRLLGWTCRRTAIGQQIITVTATDVQTLELTDLTKQAMGIHYDLSAARTWRAPG